GRFGHRVDADDGQTGDSHHLLAQVFVGALHAHDQRHIQVHGLAGGDDAIGDGVALHDPAEDVDQDAFDLRALEHDLEGLGHLLGRGATADVQEVGGLAAEQLDGVHGGHGQTGAVDQAADVAVELDVGQVELRGLDLGRIFFIQVAQRHDVGVAEQRVAVEIELGVQGDDIALAVAVQRVDLDQGGIRLHVALVELLEDVNRLRGGVGGHADAVGDFLGLRIGQAGKRADEDLDDLLGRAVGGLLGVHAAFARRYHGHLLGATVGHDGQVVFLLDGCAIFNTETADRLSFGTGLVRVELHAQDPASQAPDVVQGLGNLHTAPLAAATGVDLGLDHPDRAAEFHGGSDSFVNGERRDTSWDRHTESAQDLFALVFVNLHGVKTRSLVMRSDGCPASIGRRQTGPRPSFWACRSAARA